jgi:hypothetical protein
VVSDPPEVQVCLPRRMRGLSGSEAMCAVSGRLLALLVMVAWTAWRARCVSYLSYAVEMKEPEDPCQVLLPQAISPDSLSKSPRSSRQRAMRPSSRLNINSLHVHRLEPEGMTRSKGRQQVHARDNF